MALKESLLSPSGSSGLPLEARVVLGGINRHGSLARFPDDLKKLAVFDVARGAYQLVSHPSFLTGALSHYADVHPKAIEKCSHLHQFWVSKGWFRYDSGSKRIVFTKGDWSDEETRLGAIKALVKTVGKDHNFVTLADFRNHGLQSLVTRYYSGSPTKALAAAGFKIDFTERQKPNGFSKDLQKVVADFKKWAKKQRYLVTYSMPDGSKETVIELPESLRNLYGGFSWAGIFRNHGGASNLSNLVGMPVLIRTNSITSGAAFYLSHAGAFRHHAREFLKERGFLKEYVDSEGKIELVKLPKQLDLLGGKGPELHNALKTYHGGVKNFSTLVGAPVYLATKTVGARGLPNFAENPVLLREHALDVMASRGWLRLEGGIPAAIVLPKAFGVLIQTDKKNYDTPVAALGYVLKKNHKQGNETPGELLSRFTGLPVTVEKAGRT